MRKARLPMVARQLLREVPDADLLDRYVRLQADDAFAQLVERYSRLVWAQCRNLLASEADAEDAFQATFLTLARSTKSIRSGSPLGPWLHGVAYRVCANARRGIARRTKREQATARDEAERPIADSVWESAFAAVAEEVQKLPAAQRTAFVLCCIEGRPTTDAAASVGLKIGTFSARLTRAKQTLLQRLAKRGVGAAVLALGGVAGGSTFAPAALVSRTLALLPTGSVIPSSVQILTHGVGSMMMLRYKLLAAGFLVATGLGMSFGGGFGSATAQVPLYGSGGGPLPATPKAPDEPDFAKLKAELDRAKAELARAEAMQKAQEELTIKDATQRAKDYVREVTEALSRQPSKVNLPTKYEYESNPKGIAAEAFEKKLAEREKAGWEFVGEVTLDVSKERGMSAGPYLAFRKSPGTNAPRAIALGYEVKPAFVVPKLDLPLPPPKVAPPAAPPSSGLTPKWPTAPVPGNLAAPPGVSVSGSGLGGDVMVAPSRKLGVELKLGQDRIAALENELATLKGTAKIKPAAGICYYRKADFGNWEVAKLITVLEAVLADDIKAKKFNGDFERASEKDTFTVTGTPEEIRTVTAWIEKLKK